MSAIKICRRHVSQNTRRVRVLGDGRGWPLKTLQWLVDGQKLSTYNSVRCRRHISATLISECEEAVSRVSAAVCVVVRRDERDRFSVGGPSCRRWRRQLHLSHLVSRQRFSVDDDFTAGLSRCRSARRRWDEQHDHIRRDDDERAGTWRSCDGACVHVPCIRLERPLEQRLLLEVNTDYRFVWASRAVSFCSNASLYCFSVT